MSNSSIIVHVVRSVSVAALLAASGTSLARVTFIQTGAPFVNPIGVAYNETNTSLIATSNYPSGNPYSFSRIDQFANTTQWSTASGLAGELYLDCPRTVNSSSGWTPGETFAGNGVPGQIMRISANGSSVTNTWTTLTQASPPFTETGTPNGQLRFDNTGLFNNDLIVTTTTGNVWRVKSSGTAIHLATLPNPGDYEGLAVVPNNPTRYGPLAGKIVIGNETGNDVWTVDTAGNVAILPGIAPAQVEGLHIIPANENFIGVDYLGGQLLYANAADFAPFVGDLMVVSEIIGANPGNTSGLSRLLWNGGSTGGFTIKPIPLDPGSIAPQLWEGSTFAPLVPTPGAAGILGLGLIVGARRRR